MPQQELVSPPTISRSSHNIRFLDKFKWRSSQSPGIELGQNTTHRPIATFASHSLAVSASVLGQPHSPYSATSCQVRTSRHSSMVWAKTLEIANKKLSENNLPPLDLSNLTSQSAEENIEAVVGALNTLHQDHKKKRWSYTWRDKEVIVVERLGKILKIVDKYSKVVDTAVQSNPEVSALVWAGVWAIMRVRIKCTPLGKLAIGFPKLT